jgi:hypothetical protein
MRKLMSMIFSLNTGRERQRRKPLSNLEHPKENPSPARIGSPPENPPMISHTMPE